jgi:hypothetical protein
MDEEEEERAQDLRERLRHEARLRAAAEEAVTQEQKSVALLRVQLRHLRAASNDKTPAARSGGGGTGGGGGMCAGCSMEVRQLRLYLQTLPLPPVHRSRAAG